MFWCLTVLDCEIGLPCRMMAYVEYRDIYSSTNQTYPPCLGVIDNVSYHFPDFHQVTLQFIYDIHFARQRLVDQTAANHH